MEIRWNPLSPTVVLGKLNLEEAFMDATFAGAKKGGFAVGPTRRGKGTKIVAIAAGNSLPLAVSVESASPAECRLWRRFLSEVFSANSRPGSSATKPTTWIGDEKLATKYGIELISLNWRGCKRITQDGRQPRRYRRRWKVGRPFAWIHNFRRLVARWEYHIENFLGFVHLACFTCSSDVYETASSA